MISSEISTTLTKILNDLGVSDVLVKLEAPSDLQFGDYTTNVALIAAKKLGKNPRELAEAIVSNLNSQISTLNLARVDIAGPGFINFWIKKEEIVNKILSNHLDISKTTLTNKKIFIEYAHPNTHKEMHIGHMRTLITGESLARLAEAAGAIVFRANYQGDIGPHIAKALYGIEKLLPERELTLEKIDTWSNKDKTHFLGEAYVRGNLDYVEQKEMIDGINKKLYEREPQVYALYQKTRQWNLDYYEEFYQRFSTKFDRLFFESEMDQEGVRIVKKHIGTVFTEENGAVVFPGEKYGLHTRVFITAQGYPTYEGKEMGNAFKEYETFPFDLKIHVVANEQAGYFQVVFKALDLIDPEKFKDKQLHISMGMVQLKDRKMSSRTGDVLTVDWLLDQIQERVELLASEGRIEAGKKEETVEQIVIGAVKYSVLKVATTQDASFDIETSVSLDGNSGPYLQYTFARTQSVLRKSQETNSKPQKIWNLEFGSWDLQSEEELLIRILYKFDETVIAAAEKYSPNILCNYLFTLAQQFNLFYQKVPILKGEESKRSGRLALTDAVGKTLQHGLSLLGIQAPAQM